MGYGWNHLKQYLFSASCQTNTEMINRSKDDGKYLKFQNPVNETLKYFFFPFLMYSYQTTTHLEEVYSQGMSIQVGFQ